MERKGIEGYDERQKALRYKFGYQAFFVLMSLVFLNAFICDMIYEWAGPLVSGVTAVLLAVQYFGYRTIFAGAYTGDAASERRTAVLIPLCMIGIFASFLFVLPHIIDGQSPIIENGKATISFLSLVNTISFIPLTVVYYIKRDKRRKGDNE